MARLSDTDLVEELCEIETGLNEWEVAFVEDLAKNVLNCGRSLSERQRAKAEQILEDKGGD